MLSKRITFVATLLAAASSANAFLLPPEVTEDDVQLSGVAAGVAPHSAEAQLVKLDCPGCPMVVSGPMGTRQINGRPNHLELTFRVDHRHDGDHLLVNDFELFPSPVPGVLEAPQVPDWKPRRHGAGGRFGGWHHGDKDGEHHKKHDGHHEHEHEKHRGGMHGMPFFIHPEPAPLGFAMRTSPSTVRDPDSQLELVTIDFEVIEVANKFMAGIPELHIKLIKDASGRLMIGTIEQSVPAPKTNADKCDSLLCKWLEAIFPNRPAHPCHGAKGAAHGPSGAVHHTGSVPPVKEDTTGHREFGMHHDHSWGKLFKNITQHILLPILIGIVAGVTVSV